jgi:hypothetical protein
MNVVQKMVSHITEHFPVHYRVLFASFYLFINQTVKLLATGWKIRLRFPEVAGIM